MSYKFSEVKKDNNGEVRIIFANAAANTIEWDMRAFLNHLPRNDDMPQINAHELDKAGVAIIQKGYDLFVPQMTEAQARAMSYA